MPLVLVQIGQCGNQVGTAFWSCVARHQSPAHASSLQAVLAPFADKGSGGVRARCVLVDVEPTAVRACVQSEPLLAGCSVVTSAGTGCAGNWACGYKHSSEGGDSSLVARAMSAIRREVNSCPRTPDVLLVVGATGGTGGGLGCRLLEELRRHYRQLFIGVAAVNLGDGALLGPFASVLCVQFLDSYADAVLLFQTDEVCGALERSARAAGEPLPRVSLEQVNASIGRSLCAALLPGPGIETGGVKGWTTPLRDIVCTVCPQPGLKFLDVRTGAAPHAAFETDTQLWISLVSSVAAEAPKRDAGRSQSAAFTSSATLVLLRGLAPGAAAMAATSATQALSRAWATTHWHGPPQIASTSLMWHGGGVIANGMPSRGRSPSLAQQPLRAACIMSNRDACCVQLTRAADSCDALLASGAYLHHLSAWGVDANAVRHAVAATRAVVERYGAAHRPR